MGDEELMRLIQINDFEAFSEFYGRFKTPLYSYFCGLTNINTAEDLLQETFIKVLNGRNNFRFESLPKTWVWTIAKNTLRDHWRSLDHRMETQFDSLNDEESGEEIMSSPLDSQENALLKKVTQERLIICVNEFPPKEKEIILFHIQAELTNQEISNLTTLKVGAIKSILFRSKEKLIECFKRGGHL